MKNDCMKYSIGGGWVQLFSQEKSENPGLFSQYSSIASRPPAIATPSVDYETRSGVCGRAKSQAKIIPAIKPPIWAKYATPPSCPIVPPSAPEPEMICKIIQYPSIIDALILAVVRKKGRRISVFIWWWGNRIKYAPKAPATAPDAPSMGIVDVGANTYCVKPPTIPDPKYNMR